MPYFPVILNALPQRWQSEWFVAGSYAASPSRATDIDVWVSVPVENNMDVVREEILQHLRATGLRFEEQTDASVDAYNNTKTRKVAMVIGPQDYSYTQPIHIMVTNGTVYDVLESFDLSVCQVALMSNGDRVVGHYYTSPGEPILVLRDTPTTPARVAKLKARYELGL